MTDSGQAQAILVLDSTFLLPAFGVDIGRHPNSILEILDSARKSGMNLYISDLTPLECFLKAFRVAEKSRSEEGKKFARTGFIATSKDPLLNVVPHLDESIINEASIIREKHMDPFDCFIFATAKVLQAKLLTEDHSAERYLPGKVISLIDLKKTLL